MALSNIPNQPVQFGIENDLNFCKNDIQAQYFLNNDTLSFQLLGDTGDNLLDQTFAGWTVDSGTFTDLTSNYAVVAGRISGGSISQSGLLTPGDYYKLRIRVFATSYRRDYQDEDCNAGIPKVKFGTNEACIFASNSSGTFIDIYGQSDGTDITIESDPGYFDFGISTASLTRINNDVEIYFKDSQTGAETLIPGAFYAVYQQNLAFDFNLLSAPDCFTLLAKSFGTTEAFVCGDFSCSSVDAELEWNPTGPISFDDVNDEFDFTGGGAYIEQTLPDTYDNDDYEIAVQWRVDSGSNAVVINVYDVSNSIVNTVTSTFNTAGSYQQKLTGTFGTDGPYKVRIAMAGGDASVTNASCLITLLDSTLESVPFMKADPDVETLLIVAGSVNDINDGWYNDLFINLLGSISGSFLMRIEADWLPKSFQRDFQSYRGANGQLSNIWSETFKSRRMRIHPIPVYQWEALMYMLSLPDVIIGDAINTAEAYTFEGDGISPDFDKNACVAGGEIEILPTPQNSLARKQ